MALFAASCSEAPPAPQAPPAPRIASLSPALSATVVRLGLGGHLVGRTPWCKEADPSIPIVGDLTDVDAERLLQLGLTHLLVQPPRAGLDPSLQRLANQQGWAVYSRSIDGLEDIRAVLRELPAFLADEAEVGALRATLEARAAALDNALTEALASADEPSLRAAMEAASPVLLLFSIDPPMAFGPGSYLGDLLERLGARNAIAVGGYPQLTLEDVVRAAPRSLILVRGGDGSALREPPLGRSMESLGALGGLELEALRSGRFAILEDSAALLPSPDAARLAGRLRQLLQKCGASGSGAERGGEREPAAAQQPSSLWRKSCCLQPPPLPHGGVAVACGRFLGIQRRDGSLPCGSGGGFGDAALSPQAARLGEEAPGAGGATP
jgi:ABC-type hemin transport system substrate-binding protein